MLFDYDFRMTEMYSNGRIKEYLILLMVKAILEDKGNLLDKVLEILGGMEVGTG